MLKLMPDKRSKPRFYGEAKKQKQFMLTDTASQMLDELAEYAMLTRSDAVEKIIRRLHDDAELKQEFFRTAYIEGRKDQQEE